MEIPQEWVEKVGNELFRQLGIDGGTARDWHDVELAARDLINTVLPDILEAVAREIEQYPFGRDASTEFIKETTAQIVRNFGVDNA